MSTAREATRIEDMSAKGRLRLIQQTDGDIIVGVQSQCWNGLVGSGDSVEFCVPGAGGGRSSHTLAALRALMDAIDADNAERPIDSRAAPAPLIPTEQQRMIHDFPALQAFHLKHALGPMLAPSCLCCGQQTHPLTRPVAIKHGELPGIVICATCRDAATPPAVTASPDLAAPVEQASAEMALIEDMSKFIHDIGVLAAGNFALADARRVVVAAAALESRSTSIPPLQAPEPAPVVFGKRGPKMQFAVGNQSFVLDYEPDDQAEFDYMAAMLTKALARAAAPEAPESVRDAARLLRELMGTETAIQARHKLEDGQGTETDDGKVWLAALDFIAQERAQ